MAHGMPKRWAAWIDTFFWQLFAWAIARMISVLALANSEAGMPLSGARSRMAAALATAAPG
jgi:hypothetical protein